MAYVQVGDRVVVTANLLREDVDAPAIGTIGTVVCTTETGTLQLLICWDNFDTGGDGSPWIDADPKDAYSHWWCARGDVKLISAAIKVRESKLKRLQAEALQIQKEIDELRSNC